MKFGWIQYRIERKDETKKLQLVSRLQTHTNYDRKCSILDVFMLHIQNISVCIQQVYKHINALSQYISDKSNNNKSGKGLTTDSDGRYKTRMVVVIRIYLLCIYYYLL